MLGVLMGAVVGPGESFSPKFRQWESRICGVQRLKLLQESWD